MTHDSPLVKAIPNIGEIAERFIRAAEIERATPEMVGPQPPRSIDYGYVHDWIDKMGWRKEKGDKLAPGEDPLTEERRRFWERFGLRASPEELSRLEELRVWLMLVENEGERRALLAWSMAKAGGRQFKKWCFKVEGIHPETGRRRKDRALARISAQLSRSDVQHNENPENTLLPDTPEIGDIDDNIAGRVQEKNGITSWAADDAFNSFLINPKSVRDRVDVDEAGFSWAAKRNQRRRQREAKKRKQEVA